MSMTPQTLQILLSLAPGPQHGYAIRSDVEQRTGGAVRLGPGTLYEALHRLERDGLIREVPEPKEALIEGSGGPPRRFYALTAQGRRAASAEVKQLAVVLRYAALHDLLTEPG